MRRLAIVGACWWALGCQPAPLGAPDAKAPPASRSHTTVTVIPPSDPLPDAATAKIETTSEPLNLDEARAVLSRQHDALSAKDPAAFCAECAAEVFLIGPDANHALIGKKATTDAFAQMMTRQRRRPQLSVKARNMSSEPGTNIAWAMEDIEITGGGRTTMRSLTLLEHTDGKFQIAAQAWSVSVSQDELVALARANRASAVAKIDEDVPTDGQGIRKAASAFFAPSDGWVWSGRDDTLWSGPALEDRFEGDLAVGKAMKAVAAKQSSGDLQTTVKGIRVRKVGRGGYAAFNVETSIRPPSSSATGPSASSAPIVYTARQFQVFIEESDGYRPVAGITSIGRPISK